MRPGQQLKSISMALVLVGMILLGGCAASGDSLTPNEAAGIGSRHAVQTPTPASAATPTAASTEFQFATADGPAQNVHAPVLPDTAKEFSKDGLIAFAEHWFATLTYLHASGDKAPIMAVSSLGCDLCVRFADATSELYRRGNWIVGGQHALYANATKFVEFPDGTFHVDSWVQETKRTEYNKDGTVESDRPQQSRFRTRMDATFSGGRWMVQAIGAYAGEKPQDLVYTEK